MYEYGTCWTIAPVTDVLTTHKSRRSKEVKNVQFFVTDETCDNGEGYWLDFHKCWWCNFILKNEEL